MKDSSVIDFETSLKRSLKQKMEYSFIRTFKPVIDEGTGFRAFLKLSDYKKWCEKLPGFLGYGKKV